MSSGHFWNKLTRLFAALRARIGNQFVRSMDQEYQDQKRIEALRATGVHIGEGCRIYTSDFSTEPYLVSIGHNVGISGGVKFITHDGSALLLRTHRPQVQYFGKISVGDNTFIGENALVLPGTDIGRGCVIGAGAVVRGTIPDNSLVVGNPGKVSGRASVFLERLNQHANALDTYGLSGKDRRTIITRHFGLEHEVADDK